jgi:hypothetical protein
MKSVRKTLWMIALTLLICLPHGARAASCAYAAVNGSCTLTLDRRNPLIPPTIYLRRGSQLTVVVANPLPFERLTLHEKSATAQLPPDQFRNGFTDITTALGGLEIIHIPGAPAAAAPEFAPAPSLCPDYPVTLQQFKECQSDIATPLKGALTIRSQSDPTHSPLNFGTWVYSRLCSLRELFLPLPSSAVTPDDTVAVCRDLPSDVVPLSVPQDVAQMTKWKHDFIMGSDVVTGFPTQLDGWNKRIAKLDVELADARKTRAISAGDYVTLNAAQQTLHSAADLAKG